MLTVTSLRLDTETVYALQDAALNDERKPRALARLLIREGLKRRGYLQMQDERTQADPAAMEVLGHE